MGEENSEAIGKACTSRINVQKEMQATPRAPPSVSIELEINIAGINVKGKSIFICNARRNARERDRHRQRV